MTRRIFQQLLSLGAFSAASVTAIRTTEATIKPPKIKPGEKVGLIAPGSPIPADRLEKAVQTVIDLDYIPILGTHVRKSHGYLAGSDQERLTDLHRMFADSEIKAIWCIRGGYGCTRLLPLMDYGMIKANPKIFMGYSDITALHLAIYLKTGLVTFHGPVASSVPTPYTLDNLTKVLRSTNELSIPSFKSEGDISTYPTPYTINSGIASGQLLGGNLSLLAAMAGTPFSPSYKDKLVFMEDIGEKPYRIDRMLVQMAQGTDLHSASGIILGVFNDCEAKKGEKSLTLEETLRNQFDALSMPISYGFSFGHMDDQCTLPIGINAAFDATTQTLKLLEPATS